MRFARRLMISGRGKAVTERCGRGGIKVSKEATSGDRGNVRVGHHESRNGRERPGSLEAWFPRYNGEGKNKKKKQRMNSGACPVFLCRPKQHTLSLSLSPTYSLGHDDGRRARGNPPPYRFEHAAHTLSLSFTHCVAR